MGLVAILEPPEDLYGVAVLSDSGCADDAELPAGERGLEHVGRVHRTLGGAGPHDRVQLVDKDDLRFGVLRYLVYDLLEALLELAPVLGTSDHSREVES